MWTDRGEYSEYLELEREFQTAYSQLLHSMLSKFLSPEARRALEEVKIQLMLNRRTLQFDCSSPKAAARLFKFSKVLALAVYGLKESLPIPFIPKLEILCSGQQFLPRINTEKLLKESLNSTGSHLDSNKSITSSLEIDLNEIYRNASPTYITQMSDQKVLFANQAALDCNHRTAGEMVGKAVTALWDDDVLNVLMNRLDSDRSLYQYSYPGYRWSKEKDSSLWRRDRYMFVANYKLVYFLGSLCRLCTITEADKLGTVG